MKDLKYDHQRTFPLWGRVKLNFRNWYRKPNIYSKNSSQYKVFSSNSQNLLLFGVKKKALPTQMDLYDPYMVSYSFPRNIIIFQGVLTKFNFFEEISTSGKKLSI